MIKVNLKKELEEINKSQVTRSEEFVKEVKMLMETNSEKKKDILKELNLGNNIIRAEKETERLITFKETSDKWEGEIYTYGQIKHLAIKYNLRFLNTSYFNGHVPAELGSILLRFCEKNKFEARNERENFFILAPEEMFMLSKRPKDPLLFYRINNRNGETMYKLVHKWAEDFTIGRRISGIAHKSTGMFYLSRVLKWFCIYGSAALLALYLGMKNLIYCEKHDQYGLPFVCSVFITAIVILFVVHLLVLTFKWSDRDYRKEVSENKWNTNYRD